MTSPSPAPPRSATLRKPPTVTLWVLQALLALLFVPIGYSHALLPFDEIARQATWMHDVPRWLSRIIGSAEIAGGLGLILPPALRLPPWLTPAAVLGPSCCWRSRSTISKARRASSGCTRWPPHWRFS